MQRRRSQRSEPDSTLPTLAPRVTQNSSHSARDPDQSRQPGSSRPRSSHRSRAGCWTCRTRKVKCDEVHPRCGQCTRLNKTCDWEQRWKFDDSTRSTQDKFGNVDTTGSTVWDPFVARNIGNPDHRHDSLPSFADLTTDEDRERKAESNVPGTYNVIVNPESFSRMPEYAQVDGSRRPSVQSAYGSLNSQDIEPGRLAIPGDPNTIVLTRFEDSIPHGSALLSLGEQLDRQRGLPGDMAQLEISRSSPGGRKSSASTPLPPHTDEQLFEYYQEFISHRLMPLAEHVYDTSGSDPLVNEARNFAPLHHAICAISLLSLYYRNQARWEDALEREAMATRLLGRSIRSDDDLNSNRVFLMHYLLLIYDICNPVNDDHVWLQHLQQLKRIAANRVHNGQATFESCWQVFGNALWLETQAVLAGKEISASAVPQHLGEMLQAPVKTLKLMPPGTPFHQQETKMLKPLARFAFQMVALTGRLGGMSRQFRNEQTGVASGQQGFSARDQAIAAFQNDIWQAWDQYYPPCLPRNDETAGRLLTPRCRLAFESGYLFHCINVIYSAACLYPGQSSTNSTIATRVALQCRRVLAIAHQCVEENLRSLGPVVFAVFLAGVCSPEAEMGTAAIEYVEKFEAASIGQNASKAKALLVAVIEERRLQVMRGGEAEEVDWILLAKQRRMEVIDFGL